MSSDPDGSRDALTSAPNVWRWRCSLLLMAASGFAGLGYQIVWTQQCALWLGHESAAVLAVVAAFFGGLSVGALALGRRIEASAHPGQWYAACELLIGTWSLLLALIMAPFSSWVLSVTGVQPAPMWQWAVAFTSTFALLLPATAAMGATLPAMERVSAQLRATGRSIGALYASNTFGAVIGVLAIAFWLAPELGFVRTAGVCIALNFACAAVSRLLFSKSSSTPVAAATGSSIRSSSPVAQQGSLTQPDAPQLTSPQVASAVDLSHKRRLLVLLTVTGFLGIGYEVLVVRVLSQVAQDTVYTFAMLLAVYLIGTAAGAAAYQRWLAKRDDHAEYLSDRLLCALAASCLLGTATLWGAEAVKRLALQSFGPSMSAAIAAEATLALFAFGPPTLVMGALFSHLSTSASRVGISLGRSLGLNTLGAAAAPLTFGVLAFALLGPKLALLLICVSYLALTTARTWTRPQVWAPALALIVLASVAPRLAFIDVPDGGQIVSYEEGVMAAVSVVQDAEGVSRLRIDNRQQEGSSATLRVDGRQAWLPLLLHPAPRHALFLGLGTGVTASAAAKGPKLEVDAVELLPEVIDASAHFTRAFSEGAPNPRLHLMSADARRYVRTSNRHYDVVVSDNFHPARAGSGSLYTVEHFGAIRSRLAAQGIFCQWLPLHQLDLETLRSIVQSFITVYPNAWAMLASNSLETPVLGLVGRADGSRFNVRDLRGPLNSGALPEALTGLGIEDDFALFGSFIAGPAALKHFARDARANTDDRPIVAYRAPRITYEPDSPPHDRLFALLRELSIRPAELIDSPPDEAWPKRLAAYWAARDRFIESGRDVRPSSDVHAMLARVREPLLAALRISPDFRPAYDPLIFMASALAQTDPLEARALLIELAQTQPARAEAQLALSQMNGASSEQ